MRSLVDRTRFPSHPFTRQPLPRRRQSGVGPSAALPAELRSALRLSSATTERCVSPASANQPAITSTRGLRSISSARPPARAGVLVPGSARPEAETSSWDPREGGVKRRLTALLPLRSAPARSPRRSEGRAPLGTVLPEGRFESARRLDGVFGRPRGEGELPLTRSVAPGLGGAFAFPRPRRPILSDGPPGSQNRCLRSSRQRGRRTSAQRAFPPVARTLGDPLARALSGAVRRLLAIETIHEHDRWNPPEPFPVARGCPRAPGRGGCALANAAGRRFTAQGAGSGSRRIGLVQAKPGGATPKPIPAEHLAS
jgi:hypothetical protein